MSRALVPQSEAVSRFPGMKRPQSLAKAIRRGAVRLTPIRQTANLTVYDAEELEAAVAAYRSRRVAAPADMPRTSGGKFAPRRGAS